VNNLWLIFLMVLYTACYKFSDKILDGIYRSFYLCFLVGCVDYARLSTENGLLNNNNNSILLL
jgi:hypothetical protein